MARTLPITHGCTARSSSYGRRGARCRYGRRNPAGRSCRSPAYACVPGLVEVGAGADHREHPPPLLISRPSGSSAVPAWMTSAPSAGRVVQPADHPAGDRRGRDSSPRPAPPPPPRRRDHSSSRLVGQAAGRRRVQQPAQRGGQPGQQRLGLRVAEPGVELDHPDPPAGQGQPGVEQADERGAAPGQLVDGGLQHRSAVTSATRSSGAQGSGVYAPMPPVFGPASPSPTRLKSWAGCSARDGACRR